MEEQLGYSDLSNSIRTSATFEEGYEYDTVRGFKLKHLKDLLHSVGATDSVKISPNVNSYMLLTEMGLYRLLMRSDKPEAVKFQRWLSSEVLPALRKMGQYSMVQNSSEMLKKEYKAAIELAHLVGLEGNQAKLSAAKVIKKLHGQDPIALLEANLVTEQQVRYYSATELGSLVQPSLKAMAVNLKLERAGLQESYRSTKGKKLWRLTENGKQYGIYLDTTKKHSDGVPVQQIKWSERTKEVFEWLL